MVEAVLVTGGWTVASVEVRKPKTGRASFRVRWRDGGSRHGDWDGETFDSREQAKRFKALVDMNGNRRPTYEQLIKYGFGYLIRGGRDEPGILAMVPASPATAASLVAADAAVPTAPVPEGQGLKARVPTFAECAQKYIDNLDHVLGYTKRRYRSNLCNHVVPVFGDLPIDQVEYETVRDWQRKLVQKGLSRKTIGNIRGSVIIPVLLAAAKPQGRRPALIAGNPVEGLKLPPGRKKRREVITSEADIGLYMRCAYEVDVDAADLLMVAFATALRWGDLAGLRKRDVDLEAAEIRPGQVLARGSEEHDRWELREYTKSIAGDERVIPIPPGIVDLLRRRVGRLCPDDLVFTAPMGGPWDHSRFRERRYLPILRLAQQRGLSKHITPHALRHSVLTKLADAGTDPKVMQHMAGHETIMTLYDTYIRPTTEQRRKAAATVEGVIASALAKAS